MRDLIYRKLSSINVNQLKINNEKVKHDINMIKFARTCRYVNELSIPIPNRPTGYRPRKKKIKKEPTISNFNKLDYNSILTNFHPKKVLWIWQNFRKLHGLKHFSILINPSTFSHFKSLTIITKSLKFLQGLTHLNLLFDDNNLNTTSQVLENASNIIKTLLSMLSNLPLLYNISLQIHGNTAETFIKALYKVRLLAKRTISIRMSVNIPKNLSILGNKDNSDNNKNHIATKSIKIQLTQHTSKQSFENFLIVFNELFNSKSLMTLDIFCKHFDFNSKLPMNFMKIYNEDMQSKLESLRVLCTFYPLYMKTKFYCLYELVNNFKHITNLVIGYIAPYPDELNHFTNSLASLTNLQNLWIYIDFKNIQNLDQIQIFDFIDILNNHNKLKCLRLLITRGTSIIEDDNIDKKLICGFFENLGNGLKKLTKLEILELIVVNFQKIEGNLMGLPRILLEMKNLSEVWMLFESLNETDFISILEAFKQLDKVKKHLAIPRSNNIKAEEGEEFEKACSEIPQNILNDYQNLALYVFFDKFEVFSAINQNYFDQNALPMNSKLLFEPRYTSWDCPLFKKTDLKKLYNC